MQLPFCLCFLFNLVVVKILSMYMHSGLFNLEKSRKTSRVHLRESYSSLLLPTLVLEVSLSHLPGSTTGVILHQRMAHSLA
jgi:hypothetical protein